MMSHNTVISLVDASITLGDALDVTVTDRRRESLDFFAELGEAHRRELAREVWQVGLRALQSAQAAANAARLEEVGRGLLTQLERQLAEHVQAQAGELEGRLRRYFDPSDGQLVARLETLFKDGGELTRLLQQHTGPSSALQEVLANAVGPSSPLMKALSPSEQDGLVLTLQRQIAGVLQASQEAVRVALDPLVATSAAGRFVAKLQEQIREAGATQAKQLEALTAALDANNEQSLLSKLMRETQAAQRQVLAAVNPSDERSLLAPLKRTIEEMLERHHKQQMEVQEQQRSRQAEFEKEIRELVTRLEARKDALRHGVKAGKAFEEEVFRCVSSLLGGGPYDVEFTASTPAPGTRRKVGDVVVTFDAVSVYRGACVVVEAKHEADYSRKKALEELAAARDNRKASVGVFVLSAAAAPRGFPAFERVGADVLVQWDPDDPSTDAYLHAAMLLALALAARLQQTEASTEAEALEQVAQQLSKHVERMKKLERKGNSLTLTAKEINEEIRSGLEEVHDMSQALERLLREARAERLGELDTRESQVAATRLLRSEGLDEVPMAPPGA